MTTEYLLDEQVKHVLAALTPSNRLVCEVCLHTGLRVSDVLNLRTEQLKPSFWVREGKTGKSKKVGLPEPLLSRLREQAGAVYVFPARTDENRHRTRQAVWQDVKRAARLFRFDQNVGVHSLRKVYAVKLREKYGSIEKVRRALNHGTQSVTMIYAMADKLLEASTEHPHRKKK